MLFFKIKRPYLYVGSIYRFFFQVSIEFLMWNCGLSFHSRIFGNNEQRITCVGMGFGVCVCVHR